MNGVGVLLDNFFLLYVNVVLYMYLSFLSLLGCMLLMGFKNGFFYLIILFLGILFNLVRFFFCFFVFFMKFEVDI